MWSSQKENQETVTVMEQGKQMVFLWPMRSKTFLRISPPANEKRALTALWFNQKENQDTVTVMEQGT